MKLSLQVLSDTHTEYITPEKYNSYKPDEISRLWGGFVRVCGDIVVLGGDIGNPLLESYWSFIGYVSSRCKMVLLITGNHEYWGNTVEGVEEIIRRRIKNYKNVRYLQRNFLVIDDTVFLGCTLWSYIPPQFITQIESWAGDFKSIGECKNAGIFNSWHFRDLQWLIESIVKFRADGFKVVVLTHYTPSLELNFNPRFNISGASFAFSSDLSVLYPYVNCWIYGHTHYDNSRLHKYTIPGYDTIFISNQRGYPTSVKATYSSNFSIDLDEIKDKNTLAGKIAINFTSYDDKYIERIQKKLEDWIKNGKKLI